MARPAVEPTTTEEVTGGTTTTHPAFAQIGATRVQGHAVLYGSDFEHANYIRVTIKTSKLRRTHSNDWYYAGEELISVNLSEAGWATFLSSMNVADGVPCTLARFNGESLPDLPLANKADQFRAEVGDKMDAALAEIDALVAEIDQAGLSKAKAAALKARAQAARRQMADNLPFVAEQFGEHMEATVERAKVEVNAYMVGMIQRAGLESLQGAAGPLLLDHKDES